MKGFVVNMDSGKRQKSASRKNVKANTIRHKGRASNSGMKGGALPAPLTLAIAVIALIVAAFCFGAVSGWFDGVDETLGSNPTLAPYMTPTQQVAPSQPQPTAISNVPTDKPLTMYVIDVGQADCILLISPNGKTMLIDAGNSGDYDIISGFLSSLDITRLDAVVATHPHEDHIGSMAKVINNYEIGRFYICPKDHTTKTYERMLVALDEKEIDTVEAWGGDNTFIDWDENCAVRILSPIRGLEYGGLNNWSVVLRVEYGDYSAILTGDAEEEAEELMLANLPAYYFNADVLKVGHHGSSTSTCDAFLAAVSPQYALISVASENDYGHPHKEIIAKLNSNGITTVRTDKVGTICVVFDESGISVKPNN